MKRTYLDGPRRQQWLGNDWMRSALSLKLLPIVLFCACQLAGCTGEKGAEGRQGPPGEQGAEGQPGAVGDAGTGTEGPAGEAGPAGAVGDSGATGRSATWAGPGLEITVESASIDGEGTATVRFHITDSEGTPLDLDGIYTPGAVSMRFVLAWLGTDANGNPTQYSAYTTSDQTSPINNVTATLPSADDGGTFTEIGQGEGEYEYRFSNPITVADPSKTHTVGIYASRQFEEQRYVDNALYSFVPSGGLPLERELVTDAACNQCHGRLGAHGDQRRDIQLCTLCHTAGAADPDTGNSIDFKVMIHKIHRGEDLPSVVAGGKYSIIGRSQSEHDYSTVVFPRPMEDCTACHSGAQADRWNTNPSREACTSCHDDISFTSPPAAGTTLHPGDEQPNDTYCSVCHKPSGGIEGITDNHLTQFTDPARQELALSIVQVTNTAPGQTPELVFSVTLNGQRHDIIVAPLTRLAVTIAGPTTDYATNTQYIVIGSGAVGTLTADGDNFRYVFPEPMADTATGTYAVGMEGYIQATSADPRYAALNPVAYVAVTDAAPVARRAVVETERCNNCHGELEAHGGSRRTAEYCVLCHTPGNSNDERISRLEGESIFVPSVHLKPLIHSIHRGERLTEPFIVGGYPAPSTTNPAGTPVDFGEVRYPRDQRDCQACHAPSSYELPLAAGLLPSRAETLTCIDDPTTDTDTYCTDRTSVELLTPPESAACVSCHDATSTKAHAELMTTDTGIESCSTCHGPGSAFDADLAHALPP